MNRRYLKIGASVLAILAVLFLMVWARALIGSRSAWEQGEKLFQEGKTIRAVTFFDRSMHWYTPWNPYVERSAERLWEIGARAEKQDDVMLALIAYRTIRRGFYGTEGFYAPGKTWIERSNARIDAILGKEGGEGRSKGGGGIRPAPDRFWSLMVELGLLGWLGTMVLFIVLWFRNGQGRKASAFSLLAWGVLSIVFFVLWIVAMIKA